MRHKHIGDCRLCLTTDVPLCNSHVLPEFLYEHAYEDGRFISMTNEERQRTRTFEIGFRERLLCIPCERLLNRHETPAADALRAALNAPESVDVTGAIKGVGGQSVRMLALSILWRCHVAGGLSFTNVKLGPHAEVLRQWVLSATPGPPDVYPTLLMRVEGAGEAPQGILLSPYTIRLHGVRSYILFAYGFRWVFLMATHGSRFVNLPLLGKDPDELPWGVERYTSERAYMKRLAENAFKAGISLL